MNSLETVEGPKVLRHSPLPLGVMTSIFTWLQ